MTADVNLTAPSQNDRIMAALAHATAVMPVWGMIAPIVIWATQRDKSEYVAFQALQAVAYQFSMVLAWFAGMALYMASFLGVFVTLPFSEGARGVPPFFFVPFLVMGMLLLGSLAFIVYGLIAAAMALQGKDFQYVVLGAALKRFLQK
jgi:hypothetical protein